VQLLPGSPHRGGKAAGLTNNEMIAIRRGEAEFDAKLDALLTLARQYTELSAHVTLNLLTNYFNHFVETDLDLPAAPAL